MEQMIGKQGVMRSGVMRSGVMRLGVIGVFVLMLLFPREVFAGAETGLLLWFNSVLPTLLPFLILSGLLIRTRAVDLIVRVTGPVLKPLFGVSDYGSFAVVTGFLCGYPMGSKVTTDLLKEGRISLGEARYLLSFCNNASPVFIISYVVMQNLGDDRFVLPALFILMGAPVLASFIFRSGLGDKGRFRVDNRENIGDKMQHNVDKRGITSGNVESWDKKNSLVDACIMNGFELITKVGGYIMLFSIFMALAEKTGIRHFLFQFLLLPSLEITSGISLLCAGVLSQHVTFFLCMVCTSFGGWCAAAQTSCMISGTRLSIKTYIMQKLITAMVTSLLCLCYLRFFF